MENQHCSHSFFEDTYSRSTRRSACKHLEFAPITCQTVGLSMSVAVHRARWRRLDVCIDKIRGSAGRNISSLDSFRGGKELEHCGNES